MSLPTPYFLLLMIIGSIVIIKYVIKVWNQENKILLLGLLGILFSSPIAMGTRILKETGYYVTIYSALLDLVFWLAILSSILIFVGGYLKVKDDSQKRKSLKLSFIVFSIGIALITISILL